MIKFGNDIVTVGGDWLKMPTVDPYNPLNLPPNTLRVRTTGRPPIKSSRTSYETATLVPGTTDIYDVYKSGTSFDHLLKSSNNVLEVLGGNTTGITSMVNMFDYCLNLSSSVVFDTSSVTDMKMMFYHCYDLTSVPLFDTSNVTDMTLMFEYCSALTTVPLFDTSNVTTMAAMFHVCGSLTSVPLFDTSSVTDMKMMFNSCYNLTAVPLFDTSSVTDMNNMFAGCTSLTSVPIFDTSSVTDCSDMFEDCTSLITVPLLNTSKVTNMEDMFANCYAVESGALALYQQASSQANPPSSHIRAFANCGRDTVTGAAELAQIPSSWGGTGHK